MLAGLADGSVDLVIGTHALIQEGVEFHSLGVVVVDEQHRFGVEQRAALREKAGAAVPDVLVMTATPIPRTAAMTVYGDLDVSVLDELPPGRTPIVTRWAAGPLLEAEAWASVRGEVAAGRQAYVVCPLVEESEKLEVASAEETYERLSAGELAGLRLGLLHGRMPSAEKERTMDAFRAGAARRARRHDGDRGRRRRAQRDGDGRARRRPVRHRPAAPAARARRARRRRVAVLAGDGRRRGRPSPRVAALVASTDGFELAEVDLDLRGEGTLMGAAQKGRSDLRLASLRRDRELVRLARDAAFEIVDADPVLAANPALLDELALLLTAEDTEFLTRS